MLAPWNHCSAVRTVIVRPFKSLDEDDNHDGKLSESPLLKAATVRRGMDSLIAEKWAMYSPGHLPDVFMAEVVVAMVGGCSWSQ
jgi:hypothetical protein